MRKIDAVFSLLISETKRIYEEPNEPYWESLGETEKNQFDAICDQLTQINSSLEDSRNNFSSTYDFQELKSTLEEFHRIFPDHPDFNFNKLIYQIIISEKICTSVGTIPDEDVTAVFDFFSCSLAFPATAFVSNINTLSSNLAWFNPSHRESLDALSSYVTDVELWYYLACISERIDFSLSTEILVCPLPCLTAKGNAISLLKIYMLTEGKKTTKTIEYLAAPKNSSINSYDPQLNYAQFSEVVQIMGEYVDRKDVLSKYLSIYHVIENFMFKYPIVKLERSRNGAMFSIREFKSLYKAVETNELDAVKSLMRASFPLQFSASSIGNEVHSLWQAFLARHAAKLVDIDEFLNKLDVSRNSATEINSFTNFFSTVLYRIRCSIVHNKETEYHISSENYTDGCRLVLEDFYLPAMEELVFLLLAKENSVVWYRSDSIALWNRTV
ncbi:hypothetical protein [Pseudomonas boanensis]|uniref:hypothetical protein n=1 Tax=Metapseudomonas boanensis TaxID=2822138 RepID=UPI0035D4B5B8